MSISWISVDVAVFLSIMPVYSLGFYTYKGKWRLEAKISINHVGNLTSGLKYLPILSKKLISPLSESGFNFGFYFSTGSMLLKYDEFVDV